MLRSAATSPRTPADRTASPTASPAPTCWRSRSCCPTGAVTMLGGLDPEPAGLDLRGAFVGGEGTLGIATQDRRAAHARTRRRCARCCSTSRSVDDGAATVSAIIAAGIVPAAIEMMDARITGAVEDFVHAGFPLDAAAVLIVEVDGLPAGVDDAVERVTADRPGPRRPHGAGGGRRRRAGPASGRAARARSAPSPASSPNYYLHDTVVPRSRLVEVLRAGLRDRRARHDLIVMNVFHAGDGNLHPLLVFDGASPACSSGCTPRARRSCGVASPPAACCRASTASASRSATSCRCCSAPTTSTRRRALRAAFDPDGVRQPAARCCPPARRCGDLQRVPEGAWV